MSISLKDRKLLWAKSGNRCAICKKEFNQGPNNDTDNEAIIGEECHIIAQKNDGPRGEYELEDRDTIDNIILLCRNHHKIVDSQVAEYSVEELRQIKRDHEEWVRRTLGVEEDPDQLAMISVI